MAYQIESFESLSLVVVKYVGPVNCSERMRALDEASGIVDTSSLVRVLVDCRDCEWMDESFESSNELARRLALDARIESCRIAYLVDGLRRPRSNAELLAEARGFRSNRYDSLPLALDWLLMKCRRPRRRHHAAAGAALR